jgi:hypothetical protein
MGSQPDFIRLFYMLKENKGSDSLIMVIGMLSYLISFCMLTYITNKVILARDWGHNKTVDDNYIKLNVGFFSDFPNYIINFIIIYIFYFLMQLGLDAFSGSELFFDKEEIYSDPTSYYTNYIIMTIPTILVSPLLHYFCFTALFVSLRDNISSTDGLKKVMRISKDKLKKIWIAGILIILICYISLSILLFTMRFLHYALPAGSVYAIIGFASHVMYYCVYVFVGFASVIILGSIEDENEGYYIKSKIDKIEDDAVIPPSV